MQQQLTNKEKELEEVLEWKKKAENQDQLLQQLKEEEEGRKKKFLLVKKQYDQELAEAQATIQHLKDQIQEVYFIGVTEGIEDE